MKNIQKVNPVLVAVAPQIEKVTQTRMNWLYAEAAGLAFMVACIWFLI